MQSDNHCPRYGEDDETVNHAIFEYSSSLQAWTLSTPFCPIIFFYIEYVFQSKLSVLKNEIEDPEIDRDPYL